MKIVGIVFLICTFLGASSCGADKAKQLEEKRAEVMQVHDKAMANIGMLNKYSRLLKGIMVSQEEISEQQEIAAVLKQLQEANSAMMKWMQEYKDPDASQAFELQMEYFDEAQRDMENIQTQINEALTSSEPLVQKYQK